MEGTFRLNCSKTQDLITTVTKAADADVVFIELLTSVISGGSAMALSMKAVDWVSGATKKA
jgi:hypothetical protein